MVPPTAFEYMAEEFVKLCAIQVSKDEARQALTHLTHLDAMEPTRAERLAGAAAGATVAPIAFSANRIAGGKVTGALREAAKAPGVKGKLVAIAPAALEATKQLIGGAAGGAVAGALTPDIRNKIDRKASAGLINQYVQSAYG